MPISLSSEMSLWYASMVWTIKLYAPCVVVSSDMFKLKPLSKNNQLYNYIIRYFVQKSNKIPESY